MKNKKIIFISKGSSRNYYLTRARNVDGSERIREMLVTLKHPNPNVKYTSTEKHLKFMVKFSENEENYPIPPSYMPV